MSALDGQLIDESTGGINAPSGIEDAHKLARANADGTNLEYVATSELIVGDGVLAEALAPLLAGEGLTDLDGQLRVAAGTGITVALDVVSVTTPLTDGDKGDITVGANGTTFTIDPGVVTLPKMAVADADSFLANPTAAPAALVAHPFTTLAGNGLVYGTAGQVHVGAGTGISVFTDSVGVTTPLTDGDKGDITVGANGTTFTIDAGVVTLPKMATLAANSFLANPTAALATPVAHPFATLAGNGLSYSGGVLSVLGSTSIVFAGGQVQRAQLTGAISCAQNANATSFGSAAARSVLANATNAAAGPAFLVGSTPLTYLRVNDAGTALEFGKVGVAIQNAATVVTALTTVLPLTGSFSIPAGTLVVGSRFTFGFSYQFVRGATVTALNLGTFLNVGGASLSIASPSQTGAGTYQMRGVAEFTVLTTGAGGTCMANLYVQGNGTTDAPEAANRYSTNIAMAINTTIANVVSCTAQMSAAVTATTLTATGGHVAPVS